MNLLNRLSRITTANRVFIPQIDGLRFVAITAVIAFHVRAIVSFHFGVSLESAAGTGDIINEAFDAGSFGVQLFFAVSGFILMVPFARKHLLKAEAPTMRAYFIRRITRLEPPYVIHLAFLFLLSWAVLRHQPTHPELYQNPTWLTWTARHIFASLFYSNGFVFRAHPSPNIVLWSLEIEVQFYILAPLIAQLFKISKPAVRRPVIAGLILLLPATSILGRGNYLIESSLLGNLQYFLVGFLLCDLHLVTWPKNPGRSGVWDLLFLAAGLAMVFFHRHNAIWLAVPWLILIVCIAAFRGVLIPRILSLPWLTTVGGMCYTIYMYHWVMISGLIRLTHRLQTHVFWLDLMIQLAVMSVIIISVCAVLFALFERPFMQRGWHVRLWSMITRSKEIPGA